MLVPIRHGRTTWNLERRFVGRTDVELDEVGRSQARAVSSLLGTVVEVRCSPLLRARQTAALLGTGHTPVIDDAFIELDYGTLEGTRVADRLVIIDLPRPPSPLHILRLAVMLPLAPVVPFAHDGLISSLRTYSPSALRALARHADPAIEVQLHGGLMSPQVVVASRPSA